MCFLHPLFDDQDLSTSCGRIGMAHVTFGHLILNCKLQITRRNMLGLSVQMIIWTGMSTEARYTEPFDCL